MPSLNALELINKLLNALAEWLRESNFETSHEALFDIMVATASFMLETAKGGGLSGEETSTMVEHCKNMCNEMLKIDPDGS